MNRMKWKSYCVVSRSHKNGEQSENYFSKHKSLKRMRIPTKEYLPTFKDKMPFFTPFKLESGKHNSGIFLLFSKNVCIHFIFIQIREQFMDFFNYYFITRCKDKSSGLCVFECDSSYFFSPWQLIP